MSFDSNDRLWDHPLRDNILIVTHRTASSDAKTNQGWIQTSQDKLKIKKENGKKLLYSLKHNLKLWKAKYFLFNY